MSAYPRFDDVVAETAEEAEFLDALHVRSEAGGWLLEGGPRDHGFMLFTCPHDRLRRLVLRTLRIDHRGGRVLVGPDPTHQLVGELDPADPRVLVCEGNQAVLAGFVADWLDREIWRPIDCLEWSGPAFRRTEYVLADTGDGLVFRDSENRRNRELGPPDQVRRVWDGSQATPPRTP